MIITALFYAAAFVGLFFAAQAVADRVYGGRPVERVTQRPPQRVPSWVYTDRLKARRRHGRHARPDADEDGHMLLLPCEGYCRSRATRHETDGDGTATCTRCGTPRAAADEFDDGA